MGYWFAIPYWGILPAILLYATMQIMNYLVSRYLNEEASSEEEGHCIELSGVYRPTLSYGAVSMLYSGLIAWIKLLKGSTPVIGQDRRMNQQMPFLFRRLVGFRGILYSPSIFSGAFFQNTLSKKLNAVHSSYLNFKEQR